MPSDSPCERRSFLQLGSDGTVAGDRQDRVGDLAQRFDGELHAVPRAQGAGEADDRSFRGQPKTVPGEVPAGKVGEQCGLDTVRQHVDRPAGSEANCGSELVADGNHAVCVPQHVLLAAPGQAAKPQAAPGGVLVGEEGIHLDHVRHTEPGGETPSCHAEEREALVDHVRGEPGYVVQRHRRQLGYEAQLAHLTAQALRSAGVRQ